MSNQDWERTYVASETQKKWLAIAKTPWSKPLTLTSDFFDSVTRGNSRLGLDRTIDLLAFGGSQVPEDDIESAAKRYSACHAICQAAQSDHIQLMGKVKEGDVRDEVIQSSYFDKPRTCEPCDRLIFNVRIEGLSEPDIKEYIKQQEIDYEKWFDVRVTTSSLKSWLFALPKRRKANKVDVVRDALAELGSKADAPMKTLQPMLKEQLGYLVSDKTIQRARKKT